MRKKDIFIGGTYQARVSGRIADIIITSRALDPRTRALSTRKWMAKTLDTDRVITVSSARVRPYPGSEDDRKEHERLKLEKEKRALKPKDPPASTHEEIIGHALLGSMPKEEAIDRSALLYAVQLRFTCSCGSVMDVRRAVYMEDRATEKPLGVICDKCYDKLHERLVAHFGREQFEEIIKVVDGRGFNWESM